MMHEKKKKFLESEQDKMDKTAKAVESIPDALVDLEGVFIYASMFGDRPQVIVDEMETVGALYDKLHEMKAVAGDYEIGEYWIPYAGCFCVSYKFNSVNVRFNIKADDLEPIVKVFSNGKCRISKEEKVTIVCDL